MPSAQHIKTDELPAMPAAEDLHSVLLELHASNVRYLDSLHDRGKLLLAEGEPARGIYVLLTGRASVSISSREGRIVILSLAQPGDVLGLNSVLRNSTYDFTVKTLEPCRVRFISRGELIDLVENNDAGAAAVMKILSRELSELMDRARALLLPQTARGRLAQLLLQCSAHQQGNTSGARVIDKIFTQEEIAQMIGSSRETVTRLLASLSRQEIIRITLNSILILDFGALEEVARGRKSAHAG